MEHRFDKIDQKLDKIYDKMEAHGNRINTIETKQKGFITLFSALWLAIAGWISKQLGFHL